MLRYLELEHVGPCPHLRADFASRLNIITGDNGLGKSFLLDTAWWALTRQWPRELNRALTSGEMARPSDPKKGKISFAVDGLSKSELAYTSVFSPRDQAWIGAKKGGRPLNPGLVIYAMSDGGFAVWDPARNYWRTRDGVDVQDRPPAYVFSPQELWNGLSDPKRGLLCNGLIADWASWQKEGDIIKGLKFSLKALSAPGEKIKIGPLTRMSLDDPRDIPTLVMPWGENTPVTRVSSGVKRIISLCYLLIWAFNEHLIASAMIGESTSHRLIFIIDEIESHLNPKWQRSILRALADLSISLSVGFHTITSLSRKKKEKPIEIQFLLATHSPLIMAAAEPLFNPEQDAWFDLDLVPDPDGGRPSVQFQKRAFYPHGDVADWLMSDAFDLGSGRSMEAEQALKEAGQILAREDVAPAEAQALHQKLSRLLPDTDPFWARWNHIGRAKGWWPPQ